METQAESCLKRMVSHGTSCVNSGRVLPKTYGEVSPGTSRGTSCGTLRGNSGGVLYGASGETTPGVETHVDSAERNCLAELNHSANSLSNRTFSSASVMATRDRVSSPYSYHILK